MDDLIYRQQAIDALNKHIDTFDAIDTNYLCGLRTAMSILKEMPSAQPERKKGKWIDNDKINFPQCSECGMWIDVMQQSGEMNFCPNCGARMDGESDGT